MKHKKHFFWAFALVVVCVSLVFAGSIHASASMNLEEIIENSSDPMDTLRQKQEEIMERREELERQKKEKDSIIQGLSNEIAALEIEMVLLIDEKAALNEAIAAIDTQILSAEVEISEAENRLLERRGYLEERLVQLYVYGDITFLDVVFSSETFDDFLILFDMVETIMSQDRQVLNEITKDLLTIEENKKLLIVRRAELELAQQDLYDREADFRAVEGQKVAAMQAVEQDKAAVAAMLDAEEAAAAQVTEMIREYQRLHGDATLSFGGSMIWPLPSPWGTSWVTSEYGGRTHPVTGDWRVHAGIDIGADGGTKIFAAAEGKIMYRGWLGGYGNTVQIMHGDGISTLYGHLSSYGSFNDGDMVVSGDVIGYVGTTGVSTGNHLHFEVRVNGNHVNPWNYLK